MLNIYIVVRKYMMLKQHKFIHFQLFFLNCFFNDKIKLRWERLVANTAICALVLLQLAT